MFPAGGLWAWGWAVDAQGSTIRSEGNQLTTRFIPFTGLTISEGMSTSQTQPFSTTLRAKLGFFWGPATLIYVTGGGAGAMVHGDFSYQATAVPTNGLLPGTCIGFPSLCTASGFNSYDKFRLGYTVGGGITFTYPGSRVGITVDTSTPIWARWTRPSS